MLTEIFALAFAWLAWAGVVDFLKFIRCLFLFTFKLSDMKCPVTKKRTNGCRISTLVSKVSEVCDIFNALKKMRYALRLTLRVNALYVT